MTLDCELVLVGPEGIDFYGLIGSNRSKHVQLMAFDILALGGRDLRPLPLWQPKEALAKFMARNSDPLLGTIPSFDDGERLMLACMEHSLEGVVSKRRDAPYVSGSRAEWVKVKSPTWRQANKDRWELFQRS